MNPSPLLALLPALLPVPQGVEGAAPRRTILPEEAVVVPLDLAGGWPLVEVGIGTHGPYRMILDTGASLTVLSTRVRDEMGLESVGKSAIGDPTDPGANEVDVVELSFLYLGDALFEELRAVVWDEDVGLAARGIDGILGRPVFSGCLLTLGYGQGVARIEAGELPPADGRRVLPFRLEDGIVLPIEVGGRTVDAILDSGNPGVLKLPSEIEEGLRPVPGSETSAVGRRASGPVELHGGVLDGQARIGGLVLDRPHVMFDDTLPWANLGRGFLDATAVTVDLAHGRLALAAATSDAAAEAQAPRADGAPADGHAALPVGRATEDERAAADAAAARVVPQVVRREAPVPAGGRRLGVELQPGTEGMLVHRVLPGSLAEESGLVAGDLILAVGGRSLAGAGDALREALSGPAAFALAVRRAGERITLEVPAAPGAEPDASPDALLDRLLGRYTVEARLWTAPDAEPRALSGSAAFERCQDGRFVREHFTLTADGRALTGDAYLAWRPGAERFELTQIDGFNPTTPWLTGAWDAARERLAFRSVPASRVAPHDAELRWEYRFEDGGVFVKEMSTPDADGTWRLRSDYRYVPRGER